MQLSLWLFLFIYSATGFAQIETSTDVLLRRPRSYEPQDPSKSKRYEVRQQPPITFKGNAPATTVTGAEIAPSNSESNVNVTENPSINPNETPIKKAESAQGLPEKKDDLDTKTDDDAPKAKVDFRSNTVEFSFAPTLVYLNSSSPFWHRNYYVFSPGVLLGGQVWIAKDLALSGKYFASLGADVRGNLENTERAKLDFTEFRAGITFRRVFGASRRAPSLYVVADYFTTQQKTEKSQEERGEAVSSGLAIATSVWVPGSARYSWKFGFDLSPRLNHKEKVRNNAWKSGEKNTSYLVGLSLGGSYALDRRSNLFWEVQHRLERNQFSGKSSVTDPIQGVQIGNTSVDQSLTMFSLGFTWGQ